MKGRTAGWYGSCNGQGVRKAELHPSFHAFNPPTMFRHYFKVGYRSLTRQKAYSLINVLGLTLGITSAIVIFLLIRYELSFDSFHENSDRIHRVVHGEDLGNADSGTPHRMMEVLVDELPEVELAAVAFKLNPNETQVEINEQPTRISAVAFTTPSFFEMFAFPWKTGNPQESLNEPGLVAIDAALADAWFGGDAMGQVIRLNDTYELTVSGILEEMPDNTDFPIQMAVSHATLARSENYRTTLTTGTNSYYQTFVRLREGVSVKNVEAKFPDIITKYMGAEHAETFPFRLQPLGDVHFNEEIGDTNFSGRAVDKNVILSLGLIGLLILIVACINFVNLSTARAVKRAKEVGVRKVLGSNRGQLVSQLLIEAFLITSVATVLSAVLTRVILNPITNYLSIPINPAILFESDVIFLLFVGWLLLSLLPGIYPAFLISRFRSISTVLKSNLQRKQGGGLYLRRGLIVFQFAITFLLIIGTRVVVNQLDFIRTKSLGFDKEAVVTVDLPANLDDRLDVIKQQLSQDASIAGVSFSLNTPSATINKWWTQFYHRSDPEEGHTMEHKAIDEDYLELFDIELVAGRNIQANDSTIDVLINETMMRELGIEDPQLALGETISFWNIDDAPIVGVVKDFNTVSLHEPIHPVMLWQGIARMTQKASIKIDMQRSQQAIGLIRDSFTTAFPNFYFSYAFLDDELESFYWQEEKTSRVLSLFAFIAICIGGLGLYGLVSFMATQKVKEIGIRKMLGASVLHIVRLFTNEFAVLLTVAFLLASPIAYIWMNQWMQNYTFQADIGWSVFATAILSGVAITVFSIGYQSVRAAVTNPVENLRQE